MLARTEALRSSAAAAPAPYAAAAVNPGGTARLSTTGVGLAGTKVFAGSLWLRPPSGYSGTSVFFEFLTGTGTPSTGARVKLHVHLVGSTFTLFGRGPGAAGSDVTLLNAAFTLAGDGTWHHVLWWLDLADALKRWVRLDDAPVSPTWTAYSGAADLDLTGTTVHAASGSDTGWEVDFDVADPVFYLGGAWLTDSEANRRLFLTAGGKPADPAGRPAGAAVALHGELAGWPTNKGSIAGFTLAGSLTAGQSPVQLAQAPGETQSGSWAVAAGADDAEQDLATGTTGITSGDLELPLDGAIEQAIGVRFVTTIPQGATLQGLAIRFTADAGAPGSGAVTLRIRVQDDDAPAAFVAGTGNANITSRPTTGGFVDWTPPEWTAGASGAAQTTPDLAALAQPVVNRAGFSGTLVFILQRAPGGGSGTLRRAAARTSGAPQLAPVLEASWTA